MKKDWGKKAISHCDGGHNEKFQFKTAIRIQSEMALQKVS